MPFINWDRNNTKYVMTVLPLSGLLIGAAEAFWLVLAMALGIGAPLYAAAACAVPPLINGGIHLDGLADTMDALASHMSPEKKREILADPHTGAFGALAVVLYELITFGLFCEIFSLSTEQGLSYAPLLMAPVFTASRAVTQIFAAAVPPSVPKGMLYTITSGASRRLNTVTACVILALCAVPVYLLQGAGVLVYAAAGALTLLYCCRKARKEFGGISGDLCGWQIEITEAVFLASAAVVMEFM